MARRVESFGSDELCVRGGTAVSRVWRHPTAAALGAVLTAAPMAALAGTVEGMAAGLFMGLVGLAIGASAGAMFAEDVAS